MPKKNHFMKELREEFSDFFSHENNLSKKTHKKLDKQSIDLKLGTSYSYILNHKTDKIKDVEPIILEIHPFEKLPKKYQEITNLYCKEDIDFVKFAEKKGLEYLKNIDKKDIYVIEYAFRIRNYLNQFVYFVHQTIHNFSEDNGRINFTYHRNIYLDILIQQNKYFVTIRNLKKNLIESTFMYDSLKNEFPNLSKREREIANMILDGVSDRQISERLFISYNTVRTHRKNILRKTECKSGLELLSKYKRLRNI